MYQKRKAVENILILMVDIACIWISLGLAFKLRFDIFYGVTIHGDQMWQIALITILYGFVHVVADFDKHFFRRGFFEEIVAVVQNQIFFSVLWIVTLFLIHRLDGVSRLVYGYFIVMNMVFTYIGRILFKQFMVKVFKTSKYSNRLLLVTTVESLEDVVENLVGYNEWNRILIGAVITDKHLTGEKLCGFPVVADRDSFIEYVVHHDIDEVFIHDNLLMSDAILKEWIRELENMGVIVDLNIDIFDIMTSGKKTLNRVGKYSVVTFARNIFSTKQIVAKRALDIAGSLIGMVILGIATLVIAPAIKIDSPGPVFFGQTRVGKNGRKFTFYKFRSMYQDAEQRKKELMEQNEVKGLMFKMKDDPRITRVGNFIRRTSIDELPQFWNVLKGDMSLVGTRPPTVDEFERYEAKHKCRLSMTPGLTGLWQISGRSDIKDFDEVVKLDMQYIDNWSILKDIKILILTVKVVLSGRGSR